MLANLTGGTFASFDITVGRDGAMYDEQGRHVPFAFVLDAGEWISCPCSWCEDERRAEAAYDAEQDAAITAHERMLDDMGIW